MPPSVQNAQYDQFVSLFARHERAVRAYVRALLPSGADVDDVMQEVGLVCWRKFDDFQVADDPDGFVRWACVIGRFEALRARRRCARDRLVLSGSTIELLAADSEDRLVVAQQERTAVEHCLKKLPEAERRLLLSVHTPGDSIAMIAAEQGKKARRLYTKVNVLRDLVADCVHSRIEETGA